MASASADGARVWDGASGEQLHHLATAPGAWGVAYAPDGSRVAIASADGVRVWDSASATLLLRIEIFDRGDYAVFAGEQLMLCTTGAWRAWLGRVIAPNRRTHPYPAETFGALPVAP